MAGSRMRAVRGRLRAVVRPARRFVLRPALATLILLPLLAATLASALAAERPAATDRPAPGGGNGRATASLEDLPAPEPPAPTTGEVIAGAALAYLGSPYVAGGNSPAGFDCSGFAQFVVLSALGVDIGHGLPGQTAAGWWVDWGAWLPGDLVFFANTYQPGLSHVGIYIGDGLFVHAGDESTGVLVSSMYESYYAPRYYGAVRLTEGARGQGGQGGKESTTTSLPPCPLAPLPPPSAARSLPVPGQERGDRPHRTDARREDGRWPRPIRSNRSRFIDTKRGSPATSVSG